MKKNKRKCILLVSFLIFILVLINLFAIRNFSSKELDDVSPGIPCEQELLHKADVLYVIPKFENKSINLSWCKTILELNKTIRIHGVYHTYEEFRQDRDSNYLEEGTRIFEECFGFYPEVFAPPNFAISWNNRKLIKEGNMHLTNKIRFVFHKVYHCNDSWVPNKWIDVF